MLFRSRYGRRRWDAGLLHLPNKYRQGWLEVAVILKEDRIIIDKENIKAVIDGKIINSIDAFYCALGEAVNGQGGYFGRSLNSLADCFCGGFGVKLPFTLEWVNFQLSKKKLPKFTNDLLELLREYGVNIELK